MKWNFIGHLCTDPTSHINHADKSIFKRLVISVDCMIEKSGYMMIDIFKKQSVSPVFFLFRCQRGLGEWPWFA